MRTIKELTDNIKKYKKTVIQKNFKSKKKHSSLCNTQR